MLIRATYTGGKNNKYIYVCGYKFVNGEPRDADLPTSGINIIRRAVEEGWFVINQDYEGGFVTPENQEAAINAAIAESKKYTNSKFEQMDFIKVVTSLDQVTEENVLYLVAKADGSEQNNDVFDEYIFENGKPEYVGTKTVKIDLTDYATKDYVDNRILYMTESEYANTTFTEPVLVAVFPDGTLEA